jgi:hypothetical protein
MGVREHVSGRLRVHTRRQPTLACLALCALILIAGGADLIHTESRLPDVSPPACEPGTPSCTNAELSEQLARDRAADPLQDEYDSRAWLYAFAILAIVALATAYGLRSRPRTAWLPLFTNLGVAGVWLGIAAVVLLLATDGSSLKPPPAPTLLLPVALLVTAAAGTLIGRSEGWAAEGQPDGVGETVMQAGKLAIHIGTAGQAKRSRLERLARWLVTAALALTGLTCLLALLSVLGQPDCGGDGTTPGWADPLDALTAVTAVAGMAAGVGALVLRRWVASLTSLVVCPVALLLVLASTCAFY